MLRTLTAIIHLERDPRYTYMCLKCICVRVLSSVCLETVCLAWYVCCPRLGSIIEATGASTYHGFLPSLVRDCVTTFTATGMLSSPPSDSSLLRLASLSSLPSPLSPLLSPLSSLPSPHSPLLTPFPHSPLLSSLSSLPSPHSPLLTPLSSPLFPLLSPLSSLPSFPSPHPPLLTPLSSPPLSSLFFTY